MKQAIEGPCAQFTIGRSQMDGAKSLEEGGAEKAPPFQAHIVINSPQEGEVGDGKEWKREIMQLPDKALPDTLKYIGLRFHLPLPKLEECRAMPKIDLQKFSSTWLSLSVKKINIRQHIDFKSKVNKEEYKEPICSYEIPSTVVVDDLPGVHHRNNLQYYAETGLREVLQKIGGKHEPVEVVGTRIARALKKNETSWVIANLAGLYWRVKGNANRAIECLRVAVHSAPKHSKDVALLSIANVLHRAGYINDAIVASSYSMDVSPGLVVGHFNMANLYAAKGQWNYAAMFYESTLGLQATFEPAKQRLRLIYCMRVTQQPIKE
ncbi:tetratricopeptide repeat protein 17-like [Mercenaria mercenaria]|uniref:tetratricopeptide repeat protein 17-like n=1 Tax=Mercenaria mercenaria TaxID=6596 RepID=UPI00234FA730|nr:tetratricopeptide repeat protein 17-like [Mercenaria mercenaria]